MFRFLTALTLLTLPTCADLMAQGPGMTPTTSLVMKDEAAAQIDRTGTQLDTSLEFVDERGYPFALKQWFPGDTPVVLMLGYYSCPAMCGQVLDATLKALSALELQPGEHYRILSVSIDPSETPEVATARKQHFIGKLMKTGGEDAWHLLTGKEPAIQALASSVGFNYYWAEANKQFAHPPSLMFLTAEGKLSRIIVNQEFLPEDVHLALVEASEGKLGGFWDQVRLNCLTFDARTNTYTLTAMTLMRIGGAVTVLVLGGMIWFMLRRERRARAASAEASESSKQSPRQPSPDGAGRIA